MTLAAIVAVAAEIVPGEAFDRTTLGACHFVQRVLGVLPTAFLLERHRNNLIFVCGIPIAP